MLFGRTAKSQDITEFISFYSNGDFVAELQIIDSLKRTDFNEETIHHIDNIEHEVPFKSVIFYAKSIAYAKEGILDSALFYFELSLDNCLILSHKSISRDSIILSVIDGEIQSDVIGSLSDYYSDFVYQYKTATDTSLINILSDLYLSLIHI